MRKIAIVGGGQAGLPLALGLLSKGYEVSVVTNRSGADIGNGQVMSSQCMFDSALRIERDLGIDFWQDQCPNVEGAGATVPDLQQHGRKTVEWNARFAKPAQAVDQRIKMPFWMDLFESRGGTLLIEDVDLERLETLTASHDLVVLAGGKGEVVKHFGRNAERSVFEKPQRSLALAYVHGMEPTPEYSRVAFNPITGVGEYFVFPSLTLSGPCDIMVFEALPGGPMDRWREARQPQDFLDISKSILAEYLPWEYERCSHVTLTDAKGVLSGSLTPTVRNAVMTLPSGRCVLGLGDAVVLNDPLTGQGSNNATKAAKHYLDAITARSDRPFTRDWMDATFDSLWKSYLSYVVEYTNSRLLPSPPHIRQLQKAAEVNPEIAKCLADGLNNPPDFFPWWVDPVACEAFIDSKMAAHA